MRHGAKTPRAFVGAERHHEVLAIVDHSRFTSCTDGGEGGLYEQITRGKRPSIGRKPDHRRRHSRGREQEGGILSQQHLVNGDRLMRNEVNAVIKKGASVPYVWDAETGRIPMDSGAVVGHT